MVRFSTPRIPGRFYWNIPEGFVFVERWEEGFFNTYKYSSKGAFWKSEVGLPQYLWTGPKFLTGANPLQPAPWNNAVHLVNSKDGKTVDEIFFAIPFAFKRGIMRFDARLPDPAKTKSGTHIFAGFEVLGAGGHAFAGLHLFNEGGVAHYEFGWVLLGEDGYTSKWVHVTFNKIDEWATYFIEVDFPYLRLYQPTGTGSLEITEVKAPDKALNKEFWFQPFFANESTVITEGFYIGVIEVWRTERFYEPQPRSPIERLFPRGVVTIEIDDGRLDAYQNGFPLLKDRGFKATIAVITNLLDTGAEWEGYPTITWDQLSDYKNSGFEIAAHTQSHPHLPDLDFDSLDSELYGSLNALRSHNYNINGMVCPYADWSERVIAHVKNYYKYMSAVIDGPNNLSSIDPYRLGIFNIGEATTETEFDTILEYTRKFKFWSILLFHGIPETVDEGREQWDISKSKFETFLDKIVRKQIPVMTISEVLNSLESVMALPKDRPPLYTDYITGDSTPDSFTTVLTFYCQRYDEKSITITNTHDSNWLTTRIFLVTTRGGYGIEVVPATDVSPGYGQYLYQTKRSCFALQVQVKSTISGSPASYRIDFSGRVNGV